MKERLNKPQVQAREMMHDARKQIRAERFHSYVNHEAMQLAVRVNSTVRGSPEPFGGWSWNYMPQPGANQVGLTWFVRRLMLRRFLKSGGVLVVVGRARSGKSFLLEKLKLDRIIENYKLHDGFSMNAPITLEEIPPGLFAIDEVRAHSRDDVLRVLDYTAEAKRGLALTFQSPDTFRQYELAAYLGQRKVLFLEFTYEGEHYGQRLSGKA